MPCYLCCGMHEKLVLIFFPNDHHPLHIRALDGLRGFAVLLVIFSHASLEHLNLVPFFQLRGAGKGGVMLFFVLSSYLLDRQIVQALHRGQSDLRYWLNYALRRFLRIIPLFALALLLTWQLDDHWHTPSIASAQDVWQHLTLQMGTGVFWSIPVEFKYYLLSPLLLWSIHRLSRWQFPRASYLLWGLLIVSVIIASSFRWSPLSTFKYLPIFLVGTLPAIFQYFLPERVAAQFRPGRATYITILTLLLAYLILPYPMQQWFGIQVKAHNTVSYSIWALIGVRLLLSVQYIPDFFSRLFQFNLLRWIGNISCSIYLFHMPILYAVLAQPSIPTSLKLPTFLVATFLVSSVTYLLIERPLSRIRLPKKHS